MLKLTRQNLYSLEQYAEIRNEFRSKVMRHKQNRRVAIDNHATLYFEDTLTVQYQVQEMLRIERIFEAHSIQEELDVYNPLIPDGSNWKATFMLEYENADERRLVLQSLCGIENQVYIQVENFSRIFAISNEDLDRSTGDKTSAVHFMRFEFTPAMINAILANATVRAGITHPKYQAECVLTQAILDSLRKDLQFIPQ
jgi:hypothetical protein